VVDGAVADRTAGAFPWGTFAVNVSGSLILGFLTGLGLYHAFPKTPRVVLGTGFCGAFTTFSTFSFETCASWRRGRSPRRGATHWGRSWPGLRRRRPAWPSPPSEGAKQAPMTQLSAGISSMAGSFAPRASGRRRRSRVARQPPWLRATATR
jgi:hypothetical protein